MHDLEIKTAPSKDFVAYSGTTGVCDAQHLWRATQSVEARKTGCFAARALNFSYGRIVSPLWLA